MITELLVNCHGLYMCLARQKPFPCGESVTCRDGTPAVVEHRRDGQARREGGPPLLHVVGKIPAGCEAGTASPRTTKGMRLPHDRMASDGWQSVFGGFWRWLRLMVGRLNTYRVKTRGIYRNEFCLPSIGGCSYPSVETGGTEIEIINFLTGFERM
jgi:hypothetical protein